MKNLSKFPAWAGCLILVLVSGFHMTGLKGAEIAAQEITNPFMSLATIPVWIMPSVHWLIFAIATVVLTLKPSRHSRAIMILIAVAVIVDAILVGSKVGPFVGAIMLGAAAVLIAWSALKMQPQT